MQLSLLRKAIEPGKKESWEACSSMFKDSIVLSSIHAVLCSMHEFTFSSPGSEVLALLCQDDSSGISGEEGSN